MVYDPELRGWMEPTTDERERIMGMEPGSTRAPGVTEQWLGEWKWKCCWIG
jgi:hypothetical protein